MTPLSRYLALLLFVVLPFLGGWIGYISAPEQIVEVESFGEAENTVVEKVVSETVQMIEVPPQALLAKNYGLYADKNNPDSSGEQSIVIDEREIYGKTIRFEDGAMLVPKAVAYLTTPDGPVYIGYRYGNCGVSTEPVDSLISQSLGEGERNIAQLSCWYAGAGSDLYLSETDDEIILTSRLLEACGTRINCSARGNLEVILKINKNSQEFIVDRTKELGCKLYDTC